MRRFRRVADDRVRLRLPASEHAVLMALLPQLRAVVDGDGSVAHLRARLFPAAYDDPAREAEYQRLVGDDLAEQRRAALEDVVGSLEATTERGRHQVVDLDLDQAQSWLAVLQDLRLVLAQVVGIRTEGDWDREPDTADPEEIVLWHVGALQEELLDVMMRGLPGA